MVFIVTTFVRSIKTDEYLTKHLSGIHEFKRMKVAYLLFALHLSNRISFGKHPHEGKFIIV